MSILKELTALNEAKKPKLPDPDKFGEGLDFNYRAFIKAYLDALGIPFMDDDSNGDTYTITVDRSDLMTADGEDDDEATNKVYKAFDDLSEILDDHYLEAETDSDAGDPQLVIDYREFNAMQDDDDVEDDDYDEDEDD